MAFNGLDFALIFAFLAIIGLAFMAGIARAAAALLAIYFGAAIAAAFYGELAEAAQGYISGMGPRTGELFVFVLLFLVSTVALSFIINQAVRGVRFPRRLEIADNLGGAALGIVSSALAVSVAAVALTILLQALNHSVGQQTAGPVVSAVDTQVRESTLMPVFLDLAPFLTRFLEPLFPGGLPPILDGVPRA
jgi:uncharacterized membrane protein required for colicin V production